MTAPAELPIVGRVHFSEISKEALLDFWRETEQRAGLEIRYGGAASTRGSSIRTFGRKRRSSISVRLTRRWN
jgi:hypothetical protein